MNGTVVGIAAASFRHNPNPITVFFRYDARVPFGMTMTLRDELTGDTGPTFHFSRDLLDEAVGGPIDIEHGIGDVRMLRFQYRSSDLGLGGWEFLQFNFGEKELIVEFEPVRDFMIRTFMTVPYDEERVDVDAAIEKILEGAS